VESWQTAVGGIISVICVYLGLETASRDKFHVKDKSERINSVAMKLRKRATQGSATVDINMAIYYALFTDLGYIVVGGKSGRAIIIPSASLLWSPLFSRSPLVPSLFCLFDHFRQRCGQGS